MTSLVQAGRPPITSNTIRVGMTLVELLVVLAIVAVLISLAAMGVQAARESSRRASCLSRMRQLALASTQFEATHHRLPLNLAGENREVVSETVTLKRYYSFLVELLPLIEQESLHGEVTKERLIYEGSRVVPAVPLGTILPAFSCPSDSFIGGTNYRGCAGSVPGIFKQHYERFAPERAHSLGIFSNRGIVRSADITDGLSNTALISEKAKADEPYATANNPNRPKFDARTNTWIALDLQDDADFSYFQRTADEMRTLCASAPSTPLVFTSVSGVAWHSPGLFQTVYNHVGVPNDQVVDCSNNSVIQSGYYGNHRATSYHPGGVNLARADGSAQFVTNSIELAVWRAIGTMANGEIEYSP